MVRRLLCLLACIASSGSIALAHHSYADFDREHPVSIEGTLEQVSITNPHAILMVRTDEGTLFTMEWSSAVQLTRTGFQAGMLSVGDRLVINGAATWNRETHRISLLTSIRRPSDGWEWSKFTVTPGRSAPAPQ
jgi:hypothetical protein